MKTVFVFLCAAAPWVAIGLTVAILAVRGVTGGKKSKKQDGDYGTEGMSLGMCFGVLIGTAFGGIGSGLSFGMLAGLAVGMCIPKKSKDGNK